VSDENKPTITFNDTQYLVEDLSERAQSLVGLVQSVRQEVGELQQKLTILQGAELKFAEEIESELRAAALDDAPQEELELD
jgi:hypothetical protein